MIEPDPPLKGKARRKWFIKNLDRKARKNRFLFFVILGCLMAFTVGLQFREVTIDENLTLGEGVGVICMAAMVVFAIYGCMETVFPEED